MTYAQQIALTGFGSGFGFGVSLTLLIACLVREYLRKS